MNTKMEEKCLKAQEIYKTVGGINMQIILIEDHIKGTKNKVVGKRNGKQGGGGAIGKVLWGKQLFDEALKEKYDFYYRLNRSSSITTDILPALSFTLPLF